jgi:hypothetical protein
MAELSIHTITVASRDPAALARFWMAMLGYQVMPNQTASVLIGDPTRSGPSLLFAPADLSGFGRDRFHLDLRPSDQAHAVDAAIERGASRLSTNKDESSVRMADPEGNRFCVLQSDADAAEFERSHGSGSPSI